jgi:AcrR family transcriptional regulator
MGRQKKSPVSPTHGEGNEARILRVAEGLFSRRGYRNVTVRDIAAAAHVTHPLIYHYFGSKRGLFAAVLAKNQGAMRAVVTRTTGAEETVRELVRANVLESRTYLLTLTRAFADGMKPSEWPGGFPGLDAALQRLLDGLPAGHAAAAETEARERLACAVAMMHGWVLVEDQLIEMVGLTGERRDEMRDLVARSIVDLLRPVLSPAPD